MAVWMTVIADTMLENGQRQCVDVNDMSILVVCENNQLYAIENRCTHDDGDIFEGDCHAGEIICPRHGARFCLRTGAVKGPPAYEDILSFQVRLHEGHVQIYL
jgi:3-phenylpropionate/trans-cinnamate dioxygenase ferredoxin subunit